MKIIDWVKEDFTDVCVAIYHKLMGIPLTYNNTFEVQDAPITVRSFCAEITFINQGESVLIINNSLVLAPGSSVAFDGKKNERDTTLYRIGFTGSGVNSCCIIKKYYNKD